MASSAVADSFTSRDDAKKAKQLQEARAAGTAAPETDAATGKMINPHNPQFITQAPWYLMQTKPSLKHQQAWNLKTPGVKDWYKRGSKGDVKTKFAKGACENCGATTHTKKDCTERPRKVSAKQNGLNLMPDEYIDDLHLDYEGKRDRWNGYQPDDYKAVIEEWESAENERRKLKAAEMEERAKVKERLKAQKKALKKKRKQRRRQLRRQAEGRDTDTGTDTGGDSDMNDSDTDTDTDSDSDATDDEDLGEKMKDFDKTTQTVSSKDDKLRTTTRNLRIREDTAKYLLNLDVNSAFYDPKSRSMRDDPLKHLKEEEKGAFRGDNHLRNAGDAKALTELTIFAWESYKHGEKIHDMAQPTQALKMFDVFKQRSQNLKEAQAKELTAKYGGEEHMDAPKELIFAQNETYVEYTRDGRILKGRERALAKSKYEEDVLIGNHASPWGSWYDTVSGKWGFACCHLTMRNAYCVPIKRPDGAAEVDAAPSESTGEVATSSTTASSAVAASSSTTAASTGAALATKATDQRTSAYGHVLEDITEFDEGRLADAVQREKKRKRAGEGTGGLDEERRRKYGSVEGEGVEVSAEELEAYRLSKARSDDPMAQFLG